MTALLRMSVHGGVMIAVIAALRGLLQHRVRRGVWLALWAVAVLRLLVPLSVPSPVSVYNLVEAAPAVSAVSASVPAAAVPAGRRVDPLTLVWLCGAAAVAATCLILHLRSLRRFRFALPVETDAEIPRRVCLRSLEGLSAPLTYGLFRPVILIPARMSPDSPEFRHILQHELSHIRHFDVASKLLVLLALAVHWFNPLVWLMAWLISQDLEMRSDADAVRVLGTRKAYARTLILAEEQKASFLQPGFSHSGTARRILALKKNRGGAALSVVLTVVLSGLLLLCLATDRVLAAAPKAPVPRPAPAAAAAPEPERPAPEEAIVRQPAEVPAPEPAEKPEPAAPVAPIADAEVPAAVPEAEPVVPEAEPPVPEPEESEEVGTPEPEPPVEVKATESLPVVIYAPGGMVMAEGEARTVNVATDWVELYSDNPGAVQVGGVYDAGGVFACAFTAVREGTANVYCNQNGAWQLFAAVTVVP